MDKFCPEAIPIVSEFFKSHFPSFFEGELFTYPPLVIQVVYVGEVIIAYIALCFPIIIMRPFSY